MGRESNEVSSSFTVKRIEYTLFSLFAKENNHRTKRDALNEPADILHQQHNKQIALNPLLKAPPSRLFHILCIPQDEFYYYQKFAREPCLMEIHDLIRIQQHTAPEVLSPAADHFVPSLDIVT